MFDETTRRTKFFKREKVIEGLHLVESTSVVSVAEGLESELHLDADVRRSLGDNLERNENEILEERGLFHILRDPLDSFVGFRVRDRRRDACGEMRVKSAEVGKKGDASREGNEPSTSSSGTTSNILGSKNRKV